MARYTRLSADERRALIVSTAVKVANKEGLGSVTYEKVARKCEIPTSKHTVKYYFSHKADLFALIVASKDATPKVKEMGKKLGY